MNSIPFKKKKKKSARKKKSKDNIRYVFLASPSAKLREARIVRRVLERPSTFSFLLVYLFRFSPSLSPLPPPFIHFSFHAIHPFRFFAFPFSLFPSACSFSIRAVGFYIFRFVSRIISSEDLPAPPRVLQKKGRGARREERNVGLRDRDRHVSATRPRSEKLFSQCKGMDRARRQHRRGP